MNLTHSDSRDLIVYRKYSDVEVVDRKCPMKRNGWGQGISMTTAITSCSLAVRDDEGDCVKHRLGSDLFS